MVEIYYVTDKNRYPETKFIVEEEKLNDFLKEFDEFEQEHINIQKLTIIGWEQV